MIENFQRYLDWLLKIFVLQNEINDYDNLVS